jgi:hypothetical protein
LTDFVFPIIGIASVPIGNQSIERVAPFVSDVFRNCIDTRELHVRDLNIIMTLLCGKIHDLDRPHPIDLTELIVLIPFLLSPLGARHTS